jgi:hypothetical protein
VRYRSIGLADLGSTDPNVWMTAPVRDLARSAGPGFKGVEGAFLAPDRSVGGHFGAYRIPGASERELWSAEPSADPEVGVSFTDGRVGGKPHVRIYGACVTGRCGFVWIRRDTIFELDTTSDAAAADFFSQLDD